MVTFEEAEVVVMVDQTTRRRILRRIGAGGAVGLAGYAGSGSGAADDGTRGVDGVLQADSMPDVLLIIGYPASGIQIFRDFYSSYSPADVDVLVPDGLQSADMQRQIGNPMENVTGTAPTAGGPNREAFAELFRDAGYGSPGVFTAHTFDAVALLTLANVAAGANSGPAVQSQMRRVANEPGMEIGPGNLVEGVEAAASGEDVNYQGASSPTNFDERGDPAGASYDIWEFAPDTESGIETLDTVEFSGEAGGPQADSSPGGMDRTAMVGLLLPETGDLSALGQPMIQAGQLAASIVNDGDTSITVDLEFQDTQTRPQAGITAANSLINAGYPAIAGPASSGVNVPVCQQSLVPNQVVGCSPSSTALSVSFLEDDDFVFRTAPSDLLQGQVLARVSAERLDGSTTSTMFLNNDYGQQLSDQYTETFTGEYDGEVWQTVAFQGEQSSYTSVLNNALSQ